LLRKFKGKNSGETNKDENKSVTHKGMTPLSTQNLKVLGL